MDAEVIEASIRAPVNIIPPNVTRQRTTLVLLLLPLLEDFLLRIIHTRGLCNPAYTMLATPTISTPYDPFGRTDSQELSAPPRFPHTRAQLTAIARQYRPLDNYDDDNEDDSGRVTSSLVARVASLLDAEREEDLKNLLKETFGPNMDDEEVSRSCAIVAWASHCLCAARAACSRSHAPSPRRRRQRPLRLPDADPPPHLPPFVPGLVALHPRHRASGYPELCSGLAARTARLCGPRLMDAPHRSRAGPRVACGRLLIDPLAASRREIQPGGPPGMFRFRHSPAVRTLDLPSGTAA